MLKHFGTTVLLFGGLMLLSLGCTKDGKPTITPPPTNTEAPQALESPPGAGAAGQRNQGNSTPPVQSPGNAPD